MDMKEFGWITGSIVLNEQWTMKMDDENCLNQGGANSFASQSSSKPPFMENNSHES